MEAGKRFFQTIAASLLAAAMTTGGFLGLNDLKIRAGEGGTRVIDYAFVELGSACRPWDGVYDRALNRSSTPYCDGEYHHLPDNERAVCAIADGPDFSAVEYCDAMTADALKRRDRSLTEAQP